jgi:hypothetical protein
VLWRHIITIRTLCPCRCILRRFTSPELKSRRDETSLTFVYTGRPTVDMTVSSTVLAAVNARAPPASPATRRSTRLRPIRQMARITAVSMPVRTITKKRTRRGSRPKSPRTRRATSRGRNRRVVLHAADDRRRRTCRYKVVRTDRADRGRPRRERTGSSSPRSPRSPHSRSLSIGLIGRDAPASMIAINDMSHWPWDGDRRVPPARGSRRSDERLSIHARDLGRRNVPQFASHSACPARQARPKTPRRPPRNRWHPSCWRLR